MGWEKSIMIMRGFLAAALGGLVVAGAVFGHARLQSTSPPADARLELAPRTLTLTFNENVRLAVLTLRTGAKDVPLAIDRNAPAAPQVVVALPVLAPGTYQVAWSALSPDDGHVVKGSFSFSIVTPAPG
jgi:methionine-rich copper-binding protein CopC